MSEWKTRWGYRTSIEPVRPGIYRVEGGGWYLRARVSDPHEPGRRVEVSKYLPGDESVREAQAVLDELVREKRAALTGTTPRKQLWSVFAASRFEAKVLAGDIKSAKGRQKWESVLRVHLVPEFGKTPCDELARVKVESWRTKVARMIAEGYLSKRKLRSGGTLERRINLSPRTANTWVAIFKTICGEMKAILELDRDPSEKLDPFDTSQDPTYTDEAPNSLTAEQTARFLERLRRDYPQHYAMGLLGFGTGKRPSTMRTLRAVGPDADVEWGEGEGFIRFRRSHTVGDEYMKATKTGTIEKVHLPESVMSELRAHRAALASPPLSARGKPPLWWREPMASSALLFPGRDGGPRSPSVLDKVFDDVAEQIGLGFAITPRAMRRTFNDLARDAEVADVVTQSITGHVTDEMRIHYSTAQAKEQRKAIGKVIELVKYRRPA